VSATGKPADAWRGSAREPGTHACNRYIDAGGRREVLHARHVPAGQGQCFDDTATGIGGALVVPAIARRLTVIAIALYADFRPMRAAECPSRRRDSTANRRFQDRHIAC
jgi:hypothetical protein